MFLATQTPTDTVSASSSRFSPEFELVLASCACSIDLDNPDSGKLLTSRLAGSIQWPGVLRIIDRHRVQGLAYRVLGSRHDVPAAIRQRLAENARRIAQQNIFAAAHAARLCKAFESEDIRVAVLKGLPVGMQAYGDLSVRHSKDLDLLVAPEDVDRATEQLQDMGYVRLTPHSGLSPKQEALWRTHKKDFAFRHPLSGSEVELHWRPFDNLHLLAESFPAESYQRLEISRGLSLPALSDRESLLYLCVHGAQHAWFRLKWVADIAALSARLTSDELDELMNLGKKMGVEQTIRLALMHSTMLFGTPTENALRPATRFERSLMDISVRVLLRGDAMQEPNEVPFGLTWISLFQFLLKPQPKYWREEIYRWMISGNWDAAAGQQQSSTVSALLLIPRWIKRHLILQKSAAGPPM